MIFPSFLRPSASLTVLLAAVVCSLTARSALAQQAPDDGAPRPQLRLQPLGEQGGKPDEAMAPATRDARDEAPRMGLVESAYGMRSGTFFAGLTGTGTSAKSENAAEGGVRVGLSPLPRLTLHGLIGRDAAGRFSPVVTGHDRLLGSLDEGFALGVLGQYKAEGFSELGGEAEVGLTSALRSGRFSMMGNLVAGLGVEEEEVGEMDAELKLRVGYDLGDSFRVGAEGQVRNRLAGDNLLAGGRKWDALGGPQLMWLGGPIALAMSFGPTTVGVKDGVGTYGMVTLAAVTR
jgi:hypothetical protein